MCLLDCRVLTADRFLPPEPGGEDNGLGMSTGLRRELDANDFDEDVGVTTVGENSDEILQEVDGCTQCLASFLFQRVSPVYMVVYKRVLY